MILLIAEVRSDCTHFCNKQEEINVQHGKSELASAELWQSYGTALRVRACKLLSAYLERAFLNPVVFGYSVYASYSVTTGEVSTVLCQLVLRMQNVVGGRAAAYARV